MAHRPLSAVSITAPCFATKAVGMSSVTRATLPPAQVVVARTSPAAVSKVTTPSGSVIGTVPVSRSAVVAHIAFDPDMACA
jgi:hypothetical protein